MLAPGATWRYRDTGVDPGASWNTLLYNDSAWLSGAAELGHGDFDEATKIVKSTRATTYFRRAFSVTAADKAAITGLKLRILRDDGAMVYLNGTEIVRSNMPLGLITNSTWAASIIDNEDETLWHEFTIPASALASGNNVLAVSLHNRSSNSSDLSFNLELIGNR